MKSSRESTKQDFLVDWPKYELLDDWLKTQPVGKWKENFDKNGYVVVHGLLNKECVELYKDIYMKMMSGEINTSSHRQDLGGHEIQRNKKEENVCQIMWPSLYVPSLMQGPLHERVRAVNQIIIGTDAAAFDFDMLIAKAPKTNTITPWHQDESYWPDMPDKRAATCWIALDDTTIENGCMWFVPGSNKLPLREHHPAGKGAHILECSASENEGLPQPLKSGSCTFHTGRTLHYSRGNSTDGYRRAYITNYRPQAMIQWERERNFSHGKEGIDETKRDDVTIVRRDVGR